MRLPHVLVLGLATAVAVPVVLLVPVASAPAASPHPVAPHEQHIRLAGISPAGVAAAGAAAPLAARAAAGSASPGGSASRTAVLTAPLTVAAFRLAGVTWDHGAAASSSPSAVQIRTRSKGVWSPWSVLGPADEGPDLGSAEYASVRGHTEPLIVAPSDAVQVRVDSPDGQAPAGLRLDLVDPGTSPADGATQPAPASSAQAAAGTPAIVSRAQWGADESLRDPAFKYTGTVKVAVVHHTASGNSYWQTGGNTLAAAAQDIRAIYAYSTSTGYADLPYNFIVDQAGRIYEGRAGGVDKAVLSAATGGFNTDTMSISALGNFDVAAPSSALVAGIERVAAWKLGLFHRDPTGTTALISAGGGTDRWPVGASVLLNNISGHRDTGSTACPGRYLYPYLPTIRAAARTLQQAAFYDPAASPAFVASTQTTPVTVTTRTSAAMSYVEQVIDSGGHAVRTIRGSTAGAQALTVSWNLADAAGKRAPDGIYKVALSGSSAAGPAVPFTATVTLGVLDIPPAPPLPSLYWQSGIHIYAGAQWSTSCAYGSLQLLRCGVLKYAPYWAASGSTYVSRMGWTAYAITYIAYDAPSWSAGIMSVPGTYVSGGYQWMTQCAPAAKTGPRTCWAYRMENTVVRVLSGGKAVFRVEPHWHLKGLVSLSAHPAPPPSPSPSPTATATP